MYVGGLEWKNYTEIDNDIMGQWRMMDGVKRDKYRKAGHTNNMELTPSTLQSPGQGWCQGFPNPMPVKPQPTEALSSV